MGSALTTPNPPLEQDISGCWHGGRRVDLPEKWSNLDDVRVEHRIDAFTPDVLAVDEEGALLIEIRVTHAVDDPKREWVRSAGHRMLEIDLSRLDRNTPHELEAFERAVLSDAKNREWIAHPSAEQDWHQSRAELIQQLAQRNAWITDQRERAAATERDRREKLSRDGKQKQERKEFVRRQVREKHADDLSTLMGLTHPDRVARLLEDYRQASEDRVSNLLDSVPEAVRNAVRCWHRDAWVFGIHPIAWQLQAYIHFVGRQPVGHRFNQRDVSSWVRRSFPSELSLYRLFVAKYVARADARRAGYAKRSLDYWAFSPEENSRIPDFYAPINDFIQRLVRTRAIRELPTPIGECEVLSR
jgi:hypothetical protein